MVLVEGLDEGRNWIAGKEIGKEEGNRPRYDKSKYELRQNAETFSCENAHVEEQEGGFCEA